MNFTGKIIERGVKRITLELNERKDIPFAPEDLLDIEISKHREKRSLPSNNLAWKLMDEISDVLGENKMVTYNRMLTAYGQPCLDDDGNVIIYSMLTKQEPPEIFKTHSCAIGYGEVNGKDFTHYKMLRGSSNYDTKEMSIFIDGIMSECKSLGIEPKPEIKSMMEAWK